MAHHLAPDADAYEREMTRIHDRHVRALSNEARSLARTLTMLADRLDANPGASVNNLGVVQQQGTMIDARCGELEATREALVEYTRLRVK